MTDIKRNGSGYYDETPYKACFQKPIPQPSEIWGTTQGRKYLIVATHNSNLHTALQLYPHYNTGSMEVTVVDGAALYTNPAMVQFMFGDNLSEKIMGLAWEDFERVTDALADSLCINVKVKQTDESEEVIAGMQAILDNQKAELASLREELRQERHNYDEAVRERDHFAAQTANLMHSAIDEGTYKKLYDDMLDRLIQYGRA